ncbi:hypothetical protein SAPIO_CDS4689 [Scedosporium apiospermum]|uniref:Uncharacterized protein n=1 Tax=Pseudallescheria apiosperma TaxID=563466 RepID=A0A084G825_PSEDA|nr:uncharacterized protein SAPIO_CDS4689 [Scedosporium apiospermum]KEZ43487.1 hypothetical protein SAPIO_CDS4689 [Scedosporium apiospermum]
MQQAGRQLNLKKCTQCRKDKQKVSRPHPNGQKCDRCALKGFTCLENMSAKEQHALNLPGSSSGLEAEDEGFQQYIELTARKVNLLCLFSIVDQGPQVKCYAEFKAQIEKNRDEAQRALWAERDSILRKAHCLIETSQSPFLKFAMVSLIADLPLSALDHQDSYLDLVLPSFWETARQVQNPGAAFLIQESLLIRQSMRSDEVSGPDIARYHEGSQKLAKLVAETSDCALPPLSSVEQNAFAIIASGDARKVAMGLASIGSSPASDIFGRSMLHVALDGMVNRVSSPSLPNAFEEKDIQKLVGCVDLDQQDAFGRTALHIACSEGLDSAALIIVQGGARLDLVDSNGMTPLHWAVKNSREEFLLRFFNTQDCACLLHSTDFAGRTPLDIALDSNSPFTNLDLLLRCHEKWLEHEKLECTQSEGLGLMHLVAQGGNREAVALLMDAGLRPIDSRSRRSGWTPLALAAKQGHAQVVKVLLDHASVDPDSQDEYGRTPLSYAAAGGHEEVVLLLIGTMSRPLSRRIDLDKRDNMGRTPLFFAVVNRRQAVAMLLMATNGVNPEVVADDGRTSLLVAEGLNDGMDMHKILRKEVWNFFCCDQALPTLHDLVQHCEQVHGGQGIHPGPKGIESIQED